MKQWPKVRLEKVLIHNTDYIEQPDSKEYRKLSVNRVHQNQLRL
jgi:hypothetical protein